ncbi:sorting nexin-1 isoform X1 [Equus quagga]|uniref:Sorting nexin-1 n=1 Tax=Equus asinus TaxID=9793 RepID=A0A8C4LCX0_EQUAS|nr:sorting nexin-1 isoform X1 [Equus asinus]XP_046508630.1 sorting nexin-1 isoform X1 [Equus quagga]
MASGGGGCSASERFPPPFPGLEPESEGAAGGSEPEAGDSDTEGEDIFTGAAAASKPQSPKRIASLPINNGSRENGIHEEQDQEPQDLFADATVELSLDSTQNNQKKVPAKTLISLPPQEAINSSKPQPSSEELEEEEQEDHFDLTVGITDPEKIGDGMNAYVAYKVTTQTSLPMFRSKQFAVKRRFSDFLGLYEKLSEKHSQNGFIVPPPPEKSLIGMTKVKVGKEDSSSAEFLEKRRAALERYLQRIVNHPTMLQDPDVREFLEKEELPRAVGTQTLSGAGLLKMFNKATDAVSKMTIKMNESDIWFEEKLQEVECEEQRLRKLHAVVETLVNHRKELALNTAQFAKSLAMLGSSEDNTALSRALSQLAEVEEKIEQLHQEQANNDFFLLAELLSDYIRLLAIVRAYHRPAVLAPWSSDFLSPLVFASLTVSCGFALAAFDQRMKMWQRWQDAQATLQKKREAEARLLWANKPDKLQQAKDEIAEWESRVTQYERDFERISTVVRKEVIRFEREKSKDFKNHVIKYLETLLYSQQQLAKYWEAFLPEAKAIS